MNDPNYIVIKPDVDGSPARANLILPGATDAERVMDRKGPETRPHAGGTDDLSDPVERMIQVDPTFTMLDRDGGRHPSSNFPPYHSGMML